MKRWFILAALLVSGAFAAVGWEEARRDPVVRTAAVALPGWPAGIPPVRVVLISDLHVARPDMPPERLARIVGQINRLRPDAVLIAGDLTSDRWLSLSIDEREALAPLAGLRAPLGVIAAYGNHDHGRNIADARRALVAAGVRPVVNDSVAMGPVTLGVVDDASTGHEDLELTIRRMRAAGGPAVMMTHNDHLFDYLPGDIALMLAGHSHCGQINLPPFLDDRVRCGLVRRGSQTLVVGAGLGTSIVPLRFRAPPDLWLLTLGPSQSVSGR